MIWQIKPKHIAMLCKSVEAGKNKCAKYFPKNNGEIGVYGTITVKNTRIITPDKEKVKIKTL